jgi:hypothetical protein
MILVGDNTLILNMISNNDVLCDDVCVVNVLLLAVVPHVVLCRGRGEVIEKRMKSISHRQSQRRRYIFFINTNHTVQRKWSTNGLYCTNITLK